MAKNGDDMIHILSGSRDHYKQPRCPKRADIVDVFSRYKLCGDVLVEFAVTIPNTYVTQFVNSHH